ncbi:histidine--tRNA ligase [Candidatus Pacearchaeota archaeon CG10_big_fil_rev_8_21_14_0_10_31_24]|nr:MAG: histidine--tRNA ligase [Candidatus Pacearchaeota archaeon CG10_big_fil_rev_8_21_14_0_10_31_24]
MNLEIPKGTRDFLPEDKIIRDEIVKILKDIFENYGYNPLETPALENYETLASKYAGGAEIMKEVYQTEDNGSRKLGLRYDLTVPFARVIAMNPSIKKPFKRYQIDRVWRDGPIKLGRYREFWQCDIDVVGIKSVLVDAEVISLASEFFEKIGLDVIIKVNNRKLMNSLLDFANVSKENQETVILSLDKLNKIGVDGVRKELEIKKINDESISKVLAIFSTSDESSEDILLNFDSFIKDKEGLNEIKELLSMCYEFGVKNVRFDPSLARGLSYYTGTVLEVYLKDESFNSSLAAGGRYDKMIGNFIESSEEIPAMGMSFGLDVLIDAITISKKTIKKKSVVSLFIIPIKITTQCISILKKVREQGIKTDMDFSGRSVSKNLEYVSKLEIPYTLLVGDEEISKGKVKIRNMISGEEKFISLDQIKEEVELK